MFRIKLFLSNLSNLKFNELYMRRGGRKFKKKATGTEKGWREWGRKTDIRASDDCPVIALLIEFCVFKIYPYIPSLQFPFMPIFLLSSKLSNVTTTNHPFSYLPASFYLLYLHPFTTSILPIIFLIFSSISPSPTFNLFIIIFLFFLLSLYKNIWGKRFNRNLKLRKEKLMIREYHDESSNEDGEGGGDFI